MNMLVIPLYLAKKYETQLVQNDIPVNLRAYYFKWLRYYLDFCDKYHLEPNEKNNFSAFDKKLYSKNQSVPQRQQAKRAIAIFYRGIGDHSIAGNGTKTDSISKAKKQNNYADLYETGKKLSNSLMDRNFNASFLGLQAVSPNKIRYRREKTERKLGEDPPFRPLVCRNDNRKVGVQGQGQKKVRAHPIRQLEQQQVLKPSFITHV